MGAAEVGGSWACETPRGATTDRPGRTATDRGPAVQRAGKVPCGPQARWAIGDRSAAERPPPPGGDTALECPPSSGGAGARLPAAPQCAAALSSEVPGSIDFPRRTTLSRIQASGMGTNQK